MIPPKQESEESPFLIFKIIHYKKIIPDLKEKRNTQKMEYIH